MKLTKQPINKLHSIKGKYLNDIHTLTKSNLQDSYINGPCITYVCVLQMDTMKAILRVKAAVRTKLIMKLKN
jgi:hypothetical protein